MHHSRYNHTGGLPLLRAFALVSIILALCLGCFGNGGDNPLEPGPGRTESTLTVCLGRAEVTGGELVVPVLVSGEFNLAALSLRVGFDVASMEPTGVEWSSMACENYAVFHVLSEEGFVPLAFARIGTHGGLSEEGEICRVRFRLLEPETDGVRIIEDPEYLVAYTPERERVTMMVGGDAQ